MHAEYLEREMLPVDSIDTVQTNTQFLVFLSDNRVGHHGISNNPIKTDGYVKLNEVIVLSYLPPGKADPNAYLTI